MPQYGADGEVHVENGQLILEAGETVTGVTWKGQPPRSNYELALEAMRLDGIDFFATTTFPVGEQYCSLVVGGWGGVVVGLSNVDTFDASENDTTRFLSLDDRKWHRVRIRVTDAKIQAWINDKPVVDLARRGHEFEVRVEVDLSRPLGISTWQTTGAVRHIRLRRLRPDEYAIEKEAP